MFAHIQNLYVGVLFAAVALALFAFSLKQLIQLDGGEQLGRASFRALLTEAHRLLANRETMKDQMGSDFQAILLLDHFLTNLSDSAESRRIVASVKREMELSFGRPVDREMRGAWRQSLTSARSML